MFLPCDSGDKAPPLQLAGWGRGLEHPQPGQKPVTSLHRTAQVSQIALSLSLWNLEPENEGLKR